MTRVLAILLAAVAPAAIAADLTHATVVAPATLSGPERKAVSLLIDSVRERTRITWPSVAASPGAGQPVVTIQRAPAGTPLPAEGYRLRTFDNGGAPGVQIVGNDERGVLFGVGGLLRALEMRRDSVTLPGTLDIQTAPEIRPARPSIGLPPQDQLLRRLERPDVGKLHPRPRRLRRQRHRTHSAPLRRCRR